MKINTYVKADFEYDFQQRLTTLNMLSFEMSNTSNLKKMQPYKFTRDDPNIQNFGLWPMDYTIG